MDKYSGKKLDGRYEIQELIGAGGMANVYRAFDTIDERTVAIKILKDEFLNNDEFIRRFKNESKAIALLSHPNIVQVYDVSFGDVIQYIVVEYIDGITLKEYIEMQGAINWREAVHFVTQILKALEHAHENGIIHRDIKPQNIMLLEDGTIKVTDFGIARFSNTETRTMTEKAIGSVHYIAPEQARGEVTDGKADIYAVGVMLYELLTGKLPFEADNAVSVAIMQLQSEAKRPQEINPSIPDGLEEITIKAMQKNPAKRYQSAGDMLNDIEKFKNNPSIRFEYKYFASDTNRKSNDPLGMTDTSTIQNPHKPKNRNYQDEYGYEEEQKAPQKLPSGRIAVGIISAAVIVIVLFGILSVVKAVTTGTSRDVNVPNFVGKNFADIQKSKYTDFTFQFQSKYDSNYPIGVVLKQDPEANSKTVKAGSVIVLTVNSKEININTPYILNETEQQAKNDLLAKNLVPQIMYVEDGNSAPGYVTQTYPKAGVEVQLGSTIYVYVSKGLLPNFVTIPNLKGLSISDVQARLHALNLKYSVTYQESADYPKNTVISQTPLQDGKIEEGSTINLVVSKGVIVTRTASIDVDLPQQETNEVLVRVTVDGVQDTDDTKNLVPMYNATYTISVSGKSSSVVKVEVGGQLYRVYNVDFTQDPPAVSVTKYNYVMKTPATSAATQAPTVAPTQPVTKAR